MNAALIQKNTAKLVNQLGIADQLEGMSTAEQLREIARRFGLIRKAEGVRMCNELAAMAERYGV